MDVSVTHAPSGHTCVVCLSDTDTILDLKEKALRQIFPPESPGIAGSLSVCLGGGGCPLDSEEASLDDDLHISDTRLEAGGIVNLVQRWPAVESPADYPTSGGDVSSLTLSPCGRLCVVGAGDGQVSVFETTAATSTPVAQLSRAGRVTATAFSKCGTRAAICAKGSAATIWCASTWREIPVLASTLTPAPPSALTAAWTHCGRVVLVLPDGTVRVWDVQRGVLSAELTGGVARAVAVSRSCVYVASDDEDIGVWDVESLGSLPPLVGHADIVLGVTLTGAERHLASCSRDESVKVWCLEDRACLRTLQTQLTMRHVAITEEGDVVAASFSGYTQVWRISTGDHLGQLEASPGVGVALSPCGRWIFTSAKFAVCVSAVSDVQASGRDGAE